MPRPVAVLLLLVCTTIWGVAFVFQKAAMSHMGPMTFADARLWLGGISLLPIVWLEHRSKRHLPALTRRQWGLIVALAVLFLAGAWLQQTGLLYTTVTNGGFLTALYVLAVPVIAFIATRHRPPAIIYFCAPLALVGIFLLNNAKLDALNLGDAMIIASAPIWGGHVFLTGWLARDTGRPVTIAAMSFLIAGALGLLPALVIEQPTIEGLMGGWVSIVYAGIMSTAVAFSLQAIGQQHVPPSNAAIILSSESLVAAIAGALLLGERLTALGYLGAFTLFAAILLVETVPALRARGRTISPS